MNDVYTSFRCTACKTEIEATEDLIGQEAECPACGAKLVIPDNRRGDGICRHGLGDDDKSRTQLLKSRTIRIELDDL